MDADVDAEDAEYLVGEPHYSPLPPFSAGQTRVLSVWRDGIEAIH